MSQLVDSAKHSNIAFPELAVSSTASHCAEQEIVDLDDFPHLVGRDERALSSSGVDSDQDTLLELEGERGGSLGEVGHLGSHLLEVSLEVYLVVDRGQFEAESI